jgi:D-psicose/D-tagatose/L-ribulose 3-epimerase
MKLCVSNIAWAADQEKAAADILREHDIDYAEVAPTKYWPAPCAPTADELDRCQQFWTQQNVPIQAMQSLLFGLPHLSIFQPEVAGETRDYLIRILQIGAALGAKRFVFGSPKNRDRGQLTVSEANCQATDFFQPIAEIADELGVIFCLEPNPTVYQCNFMTNTAEALAVVDAIDHPGIGLHLDSGIMCLNDESVEAALAAAGSRLKHFHVSHPQLAAVVDGGPVDHARIAGALRANGYSGMASVEMRSAQNPADNLTQLHIACDVLNQHYRR